MDSVVRGPPVGLAELEGEGVVPGSSVELARYHNPGLPKDEERDGGEPSTEHDLSRVLKGC